MVIITRAAHASSPLTSFLKNPPLMASSSSGAPCSTNLPFSAQKRVGVHRNKRSATRPGCASLESKRGKGDAPITRTES